MSLGKALVDELRNGTAGPVEVQDEGVVVTADVVGSGPYGAELRGLRIEGGGALDVQDASEALVDRVNYLPERLEALEVEAQRGILRTARDQVKDREYYELEVAEGRVDLGRFRYDAEAGARSRVPENFGHRMIERLVDDLAEVLQGDEPE